MRGRTARTADAVGTGAARGHRAPRTHRSPLAPRALLPLGALLLCAAAGDTVRLSAQPPEAGPAERIRESVVLDTDPATAKRIATAGDYLREREWGPAIDILQQAAAVSDESVISVAPGRYVGTSEYCRMILAGLPAEGLAEYRRKHDATAARRLEEGRARRDEALVAKVVHDAFVSGPADDALLLLGQWAWDRGDLTTARQTWTKLLPWEGPVAPGRPLPVLRYPDSDLDRAGIQARLVLCSIAEGDADRARRELAVFRTRFPESEGTLAGRTARWTDLLDEALRTATGAARPTDDAGDTFAGSPTRTRIVPAVPDVGAPLWSVPFARAPQPGPLRGGEGLRREGPTQHPVAWGDVVLYHDADRISARDLLTGKPWPDPDDSPVLYPEIELVSRVPSLPVIGTAWFTGTVADGRYYARMGSPATGRARSEPIELASDLVCLDLARGQGRRAWKVSVEALEPQNEGWSFEGSPVVSDGRVFVALRRGQPQTQVDLACLDAETGRVQWLRRVCSAVAQVPEMQHVATHLLPTVGEGTVFLSTDLGAVGAFEAATGNVRWIATYESRGPVPPHEANLAGRPALVPAVFRSGVVYVAPNDADEVTAYDAASGLVLWKRGLPDRIAQIVGIAADRLIVGGRACWGLELRTGRPVWGRTVDEPEEFGYGRALLTDGAVWWPRREAIDILDPGTGRPVGAGTIRLSPDKGGTGGNLSTADGVLLVAEAGRLVAYGEHGALRKRIDDRLSQRPDDPAAWDRRARLLAAEGRPAEALLAARKRLASVGRRDPHALVQIARLTIESVRANLDGVPFDVVASELRRTARDVPECRAPLEREIARIALERGDPPRAAAALYDLAVRDDPLADRPLRRRGPTARDEAAETLASLLREGRPGVRDAVEEAASRYLRTEPTPSPAPSPTPGSTSSSATDSRSPIPSRTPAHCDVFSVRLDESLARVRRDRFSRTAADLRLELADRCVAAARDQDTYRLLDDVVRFAPDSRRTPEALLRQARACEQAGWRETAWSCWQRLASAAPEHRVAPDRSEGPERVGAGPTAAEHVAMRAADPRFADCLVPARGGPWRRETVEVATRRVLVPTGTAPDPRWRHVALVAAAPSDGPAPPGGTETTWSLVDLVERRPVAALASTGAFRWAGFVGPVLVAGGSHATCGFDPATGRLLWHRESDERETEGAVPHAAAGDPPIEAVHDARDGQPSQRSTVPHAAESDSAPRIVAGRYVIGAPDGDGLRALDACDGRTAWRYRARGASLAPVRFVQKVAWDEAAPRIMAARPSGAPESRTVRGMRDIVFEDGRPGIVVARNDAEAGRDLRAESSSATGAKSTTAPDRTVAPAATDLAARRARRTEVVVQELPSRRIVVLDAESGRTESELDDVPVLLSRSPVRIGRDGFFATGDDHAIRGWDLETRRVRWRYAGPMSHANAAPELLGCGETLLLVVDGDTLVSVEPGTGRDRWRRPLARTPVPRMADIADCDEDGARLFVVVDGMLTCVATADGATLWRLPLSGSDGPSRWIVRRIGARVVASPAAGSESGTGPASVVVCEAETGRPVQSFPLLRGAIVQHAAFDVRGGWIVLPDRATALVPFAARTASR